MLQPTRHKDSKSYRYGFQGQEKDDEIKGEGNSVNYKYRMHDPRIGRFFAVDPLTKKYPHYTPYSFSGNKVTAHVELEGLEELYYGNLESNKKTSKALEIFKSTDVGLDAIREIWNTEGTDRQMDVYFTLASYSSEGNGFTMVVKNKNIAPGGKLPISMIKTAPDKVKQAKLGAIDLSVSKREGNDVAIIVINMSGNAFLAGTEKSYESNLKLSETIYHELFAHVCAKLCPIDGDEKSESQEHFRYAGWYSHYSYRIKKVTPGTPRQKYIDEAKEVIEMYEELMNEEQEKEKKDSDENK